MSVDDIFYIFLICLGNVFHIFSLRRGQYLFYNHTVIFVVVTFFISLSPKLAYKLKK